MASILIVDDDPNFRRLTSGPLLQRGHQVTEAGGVSEAQGALARQAFDFALVDVFLRDGSGLELIRWMRGSGARMPVGIVSGRLTDVGDLGRLKSELGAVFVMSKPVIPALFLREIVARLEPAAPTPTPTKAESLQLLRDTYQRELPGLMEELLRTFSAALAGLTPTELPAGRALAHRVHGTAGSLGFRRESIIGKALEEGAVEVLGGNASGWERIRLALELPPDSVPAPARRASMVLEEQTLLVVDSEPSTHATLARLGREQLVGVVPARDAAEALSSARRYPPTAMLLAVDSRTKEATCRLASELHKLPGCESIPVVFLSSEDDLELRLAAARARAALFLTKPVDEESFAALLELLRAGEAPSLKALVVDDDARAAEALRLTLLEAGYRAELLAEPTRLFEALEAEQPDVVLLDAMMPLISGFELCRMIRASVQWKYLPVIFVTASANLDTRIAAFEAGGDDWILKPVLPRELQVRIEARRERLRSMRERSLRDPLTGLMTRPALLERFSKMVTQTRASGRPFSVVMLDVDHFKRVNDEHGHASGDRVLAGLGQLLQSRLRQGDACARWGGEEFALLIEGESAPVAQRILLRILNEVRSLAFRGDTGERFQITFSAGIAEFPRDGELLEDLTRAADGKLYEAKAQGRDRVCI